MKNPILALIACFVLLTSAAAAELDGVKLADQSEVGGKLLRLNGMGTRKATLFNVKVYIAGLYVEAPSKVADEILNSPQIKKIQMHFVHDVGAEKLRNAWNESFEKNCKSGCEALKPALEKLNSLMTDIKDGEEMAFAFFPGKIVVQIKGQTPVTIDSGEFARVLLSTWLGASPPNEGLKEGLLGHQ